VLVDDASDAVDGAVQRRVLGLHVRLAAADRVRRVVRAQTQVVGEPGAHGLVSAVHGDEVDVAIDDEIGFGRTARDAHLLVRFRFAQLDDAAGFFRVVVRIAVGEVRVEDLRPHHALHLARGHAAVEGVGDEQVDVVDAAVGEQVEDDFEDDLPDVRRAHRRQRDRDVVDGDEHLHARPELRVQGIATFGMVDGPADRGAPVGERLDWRIGEDDARPDRDLLEQDVAVGKQQPRRRLAVLDDDLRVLVVTLAESVQRTHRQPSKGRFLPEIDASSHLGTAGSARESLRQLARLAAITGAARESRRRRQPGTRLDRARARGRAVP
jgi:hypothetical protein